MRLLLLGSYAESLLNFRGSLIKALLQAGVEVHVAAPGLLADNKVVLALCALGAVPHDVPLQRTGINPFADVRALYRLWQLMRHLQPDVFMGYTIKPVVYGSLAAWLAGVERRYALITGLGYTFQQQAHGIKGRLVSKLAHNLYGMALRRTTKVFFQNSDDEALFRELQVLPSHIPSVIINGSGVDIEYFQAHPPLRGEVVFLMIARLLVAKGVREYAKAAMKIRADSPAVRFQLAGWLDEGLDAIDSTELASWTGHGGLEYLGKLDDVRPALRECSVYVLPSYREGTPRTVLEAMATGRPVITTDAPGCRETVVEGRNGYQVQVGSVDDLEFAMRRFIDNPNLLPEMGTCSRRLAEEKYDVRQVNAIMLTEMGIE